MSLYKNSVIIRGRLGASPEITTIDNPSKYIINLRIATNESWFNKKTNEWNEETTWHQVVAFGEYLYEKIQKFKIIQGALVEVTGRIKTEKWEDQTGNTRYTNKIIMGIKDSFAFFPIEKSKDENKEEYVKNKIADIKNFDKTKYKPKPFQAFDEKDDDLNKMEW